MRNPITNNVYMTETEKFNALADEWWNPHGKFRPLHLLQPCRLDFINSQVEIEFDRQLGTESPFSGLSLLDVGCGGGLLCEPFARLGAEVTGIDIAERNIPVAQSHADQSGLNITYRHASAEEIASENCQFDIVLCMEVIEHVPDPKELLSVCASLLSPSGLLICSTINRNLKSFALAIIAAEYVLNWLPKGTHNWNSFITPEEILEMQSDIGLKPIDCKGFVFNPIKWEWNISSRDTSVNYVTACKKPE